MIAEPALSVRDLHHFFGDHAGVPVFEDITFDVARGEFLSIVGPSGCGKTTLLRILAGLIPARMGTVTVRNAAGTKAIGIVFQNDRLLPWRTVAENVRLPLEATALPAAERRTRIADVLDLVRLGDYAGYYPHQLSGGMRQRVNLARALVNLPAVLLLDEPFAALDALTREQMQEELMRLSSAVDASVVLVTHQIDEAVYLGDRVLVMGARPARIKAVLPIPFARPRAVAVKMDDAFFHLNRSIWTQLHPETPIATEETPA